jgi:hypothetical protein
MGVVVADYDRFGVKIVMNTRKLPILFVASYISPNLGIYNG